MLHVLDSKLGEAGWKLYATWGWKVGSRVWVEAKVMKLFRLERKIDAPVER